MKNIKPKFFILSCLVLLLLVLQWSFWFAKGGLLHFWRYQNELKVTENQNKLLIERNNKLKAEIFNLQNKTEAIEDKARSELGLIKEGETFYHIIEHQPKMDE